MKYPIWICLMLLSCAVKQPEEEAPVPVEKKLVQESLPDTTELEKSLLRAGLVDINKLDPSIRVELKYSGTDNFLKTDVYGDFNRAYLQPDVAVMLVKAQQYLKEVDSGLSLLIYDAVRPRSVQQKMWELLKMSDSLKEGYVSNPANGSIHNYGAAVDLTVCTASGTPLDMGTPFDFFGELAQPRFESRFLNDGQLTRQQADNRLLLRNAMQKAGFRQLPTEWWHYNACSREEAKNRYAIIE